MFERNVYDAYGLFCDSRFSIGRYEGFEANGQSFILLPKKEAVATEQEMLKFTHYLRTIGDYSVLEPMVTIQRQQSGLIDGETVYVCQIPQDERSSSTQIIDIKSRGEHLAKVHYYGKQMPYESRNYEFFGQWHKLWEKRLEQLESWYEHILFEAPKTYVDEAFLFSFPYYMGLTENAIQYVVDAMMDDPGKELDHPTICHRRFTDGTWLVLAENGQIAKRPTEFVYDHPCRDLSEWVRDQILSGDSSYWDNIQTFLNEYEKYEQLTTYSWRLLYARLLFPLHYFETIEQYYGSQLREIKEETGQAFFYLLEQEYVNEQFLKEFAKDVLSSKETAMQRIPMINWL